MTTKIVTAIVLAASVLVVSSAAEAGQRRHGGHKVERHNKHFNKHNRHNRHDRWNKHRRHHNGHFGIYFGYEDPYELCAYYKRKAYHTGSRYWWKKYKRCIRRY